MAERIMLRCKVCGEEFFSGIGMDRRTFESAGISGNEHECPQLHSATYETGDYYFS